MNCPFCGEADTGTINYTFACGTLINDPEPRTKICYMGWVNKLKAELAEVKTQLADRDERLDDYRHLMKGTPHIVKEAEARLKAAGEI